MGTLESLDLLFEVEGLPAENLTIAGNLRARGSSSVLTDLIATIGPASVTINGEINGCTSAVMTGGLSFLYKGFADRATAGASQCESTLAELGAT